VVAYEGSGEVLERLELCAAQLEVPADATGTCGNGVVGSSSPVVNGSWRGEGYGRAPNSASVSSTPDAAPSDNALTSSLSPISVRTFASVS
jgi:hypothetical protein